MTGEIEGLEDDDVQKEYRRAKAEGRQPLCPYCGAPLEIGQFYTVYVRWTWDKRDKIYKKDDTNWEAEKPFCDACEEKDWDFINTGPIEFEEQNGKTGELTES